MRRLDGITDSADTNLSTLWDIVKKREAWHAAVPGVSDSWTGLSDWRTMWWAQKEREGGMGSSSGREASQETPLSSRSAELSAPPEGK